MSIEAIAVAIASPTAPRMPVGSMPCQGTFYRPAGRVPRTAFIAAHYSADMSGHFLAERVAERGYGFLGWNTRYRGSEDMFAIEQALIDVGAGVHWLKSQGVETVILLGNSGGGSLMAAYQSQAVEHPMTHASPVVADALADLMAGNFYISLNAHAGRPEYLTSLIDPSVTDEGDSTSTDPSLDMYNPENGPPFSEDFVETYRAAQITRNRRITKWVLTERERLAAKGYTDRIFSVPRVWADLRFLDGTLDPSDRPLGRCYAGDPAIANRGPAGVARATSLATWLSLWSLDHSPCRAGPHLANITVPSLVIQTTHDIGVFPSDAESIHDGLAAKDKTLMFCPGTHFLSEPTSARENILDIMLSWLEERGVE